jgi:GABA permease
MTHSRPHPAGILVVANRTCPCPMLLDEVARRAGNAPVDVLVVVPALNSRLRHWLSDIDDAVARAHERLEVALADLRTRGVSARGEVGDANPLVAIEDALAHFPASAIVIATLPPGRSNWLERGLIDKARARFDVPVTHLVSSEGLVEERAAA